MATYYLPLWYQATKGVTATKSGLDILPYMLSTVVGAALSGAIISKTGRYWPFLVISPLVFSVGAGLLYTVDAKTANAAVIGFQILYGVGVGGAMQNTIISIQAEFSGDPESEAMIPQATSLVNFTQLIGGVIGIAIAGTVFSNQLSGNLPKDLDPEIAKAVAQSVLVIKTLPDALRGIVIDAYVKSLRYVFIIAVPAGAFASLSAL
jgi:MFS family permease